jgi:hypothetical protein
VTDGKITTGPTTLSATLPTGGPAATVTGLAEFEGASFQSPLYTQYYVNWNTAGHSGYAGGGDVANVLLAANTPATTAGNVTPAQSGGNAYLVGYLGWADGYSLLSATNPGTQLFYNGVKPSVANIANGLYTFWAYEHMYYLTTGYNGGTNAIVAGSTQTVADGIADLIYNQYACTNGNGVTAGATISDEDALSPPPAGILNGTGILVKKSVEEGSSETTY